MKQLQGSTPPTLRGKLKSEAYVAEGYARPRNLELNSPRYERCFQLENGSLAADKCKPQFIEWSACVTFTSGSPGIFNPTSHQKPNAHIN